MADARPPTFGAQLKRLRVAAGLSQEALAERAGVSAQAISALERGVRKAPYKVTVAMLADALALVPADRAALESAAVKKRGPREPTPTAPMPLAAPATAFIGREAALEELCDIIRGGARVATLTGPGGIGKTRLALACVETLRKEFPDGATVVSLGAVSDAELVAPTIAATIGLRVGAQQQTAGALLDYLANLRHLLLLDNFEQVLAASAIVAEITDRCPNVAVLVTSRALLRVAGEREYAVSALAMPSSEQIAAADLANFAGTRLFLDRVYGFNPKFEAREGDVTAIAEICRKLDGLPLAIELAAPLTRFFSPSALLKRLDRRLDVLVMGSRDMPRHQTMRNAIGWSYDLLGEPEQSLFRRLAVFLGGWTVEAAQAVCMSGDRASVFEPLATLLDFNLLNQGEHAGEIRIGMLETVREFALEKLEQSGEHDATSAKHAGYFADFAAHASRGLSSADQADWYALIDSEIGNLRAAMHWAQQRRDPELGLTVASRLRHYWEQRGLLGEGRNWLEVFLAAASAKDLPPSSRLVDALQSAGVLADRQDDYLRARQHFERAADAARELGDQRSLAQALSWLGSGAQAQGDYDRAAGLHEQSVAIARAVGDTDLLAVTLNNYGLTLRDRGDLANAADAFAEALALARAGGMPLRIALIEANFAVLQRRRGDLDSAAKLLEESAQLRREVGDRYGTVIVLVQLGDVALQRCDVAGAGAYYRESLRQNRTVAARELFAMALEGLARTAFASGDARTGVLLASAAAHEREAINVPMPPTDQKVLSEALAGARDRLGGDIYEAAWSDGKVRLLHDIIAECLSAQT